MTRTTAIVKPEPILSGLTSLANLKLLAEPEVLGPQHKPVPHWAVAEAMEAELKARFGSFDAHYEVMHDGLRLDATYDLGFEKGKQKMLALREQKGNHYMVPKELQADAGAVIVMTHANDKSRALRLRSALRVYICTNLAMALEGSVVTRGRKHTGDESWESRINVLLDTAVAGFTPFGERIEAMRNAQLTDEQAKSFIYDVFATMKWTPVAPNKFLEVGQTYFDHATPDVAEKNRWSLHNAFTRVMRETRLFRQVETSDNLLRLLSEDIMAVGAREDVLVVEPLNPN